MKVEEVVRLLKEVVEEKELLPVILSIARVESSFNPFACRYEPNYRWLYKPEEFYRSYSSTVDTEIFFQKCSLGLMQVMGAVFRELGYREPLPKVFCDVKAQLLYGYRHFLRFYKKYESLEEAISSYNAGSPRRKENGEFVNQTYVDRVLREVENLRELV